MEKEAVSDTPDLTASLLPHLSYFPHPALVPGQLVLNGVKPVPMSALLRLGACSDEGPDSVVCQIEPSPDLPTDPDSPPPVVGGLNILRSAQLTAGNGRKVVAWFATVTGLTFRADADDRVYVEGADGMVVLHDGKAWAERHGESFRPTVWAREERFERKPVPPLSGKLSELSEQLRYGYKGVGKSRRYESYAAMVEARNAHRLRPTHGIAPDAIGPLLGITPMIGGFGKSAVITTKPLDTRDGLEVRRTGTRYELRLDEDTAKRLHGERAKSAQAVLRYDAPVIATEDTVDLAAMQLLRNMDSESLLVIVGLLMNAYDSNNRVQRIGAFDLAKIRGTELTKASEKRTYSEMSRMLRDVVIDVRPMSAKPDGVSALLLPLFVNQGNAVARGGKLLPLVTMNAALFEPMKSRGHGVMLSRRLLEVDLRVDEWAARIDMALAWQWAMGWKVNGYADGKRLRRTMRQLLTDAGIPYDIAQERKKRGTSAVRLKFAATLDALVGLRMDLKSWKLTKEAHDPADDVYELTPSAQLATALTTRRQPALKAHPAPAKV